MLKIYNKLGLYSIITLGVSLSCMALSIPSVNASTIDKTVKSESIVTHSHVLNWVFGLVIVLCLFFACVWLVRKTGALSINTKTNMKVVSGLSLGMREKLLLVQIGEKQLVLGITPGRIDKLLLLEGDDQLFKDATSKETGRDFSNKLKQVLAGSENE